MISKRDYFAGQAVNGLIQSQHLGVEDRAVAVAMAYHFADEAMKYSKSEEKNCTCTKDDLDEHRI